MGKLTATLLVLITCSCATRAETRKTDLADLGRDLALEHGRSAATNALHPSHGTDGASKIEWFDLCAGKSVKECGAAEMRYSQVSRDVALSLTTIEQLAFIIRQLEAGVIKTAEAEPWLEYGWSKLPDAEQNLVKLRAQLMRLEPDEDFGHPGKRQDAWSAIELAAEQLERANDRLDGLAGKVDDHYRQASSAPICDDIPDGVVLPDSSKLRTQLRVAQEAYEVMGENPEGLTVENVALRLIADGSERAASDAKARGEHVGPRFTYSVVDSVGTISESRVRDWLARREGELLRCASALNEIAPVDVMIPYTREAAVLDIELRGDSVSRRAIDCVESALEQTSIGGALPGRAGFLRIRVAVFGEVAQDEQLLADEADADQRGDEQQVGDERDDEADRQQ